MCFLFILSVEFDQCLSNCGGFPAHFKAKAFPVPVYKITSERLKCWEPIKTQILPHIRSLLPNKMGLGVSEAATKGNLKTD